MGRPALALLALLAIFSGADAKKTKKLSAAEREERRAKGELLMNAVNLGDREEVERLIEEEDAGKCVNHDAGGGKGAPLRNAAKMGYTRIVDILLQAGADIDQPNTVGVTPLWRRPRRKLSRANYMHSGAASQGGGWWQGRGAAYGCPSAARRSRPAPRR